MRYVKKINFVALNALHKNKWPFKQKRLGTTGLTSTWPLQLLYNNINVVLSLLTNLRASSFNGSLLKFNFCKDLQLAIDSNNLGDGSEHLERRNIKRSIQVGE